MAKLTRKDVEQIVKVAREKGVRPDLSGTNLSGADLRRANLSGADLIEVDLLEADLIRAHLIGADLTRANLTRANLRQADLSGANLIEAQLFEANLFQTNLTRANLSGAYLSGAHLSRAHLIEANLSKATIYLTSFSDIDLSEAKGLDTIRHEGPSTIGIDTIYRSKGSIPEVFLREAGVPENFITYMASLSDKAFDYYSCFISHSSKDEAFAKRLYKDLQQEGVRCWFAPEDMKIGDKIRQTIDQTIRSYDKLLIVLSEQSINSNWVEKEVETAFEEEARRKQTVLFPIRLDQTVMDTPQAWAADIRRQRHIGDFRRWKDHDAYTQAFDRLLRDLKSDAAPPPLPPRLAAERVDHKPDRIQSLERQLMTLYETRNELEERAAQYGALDIPTSLRNEIKLTKQRIEEAEQELSELEG